MAAILERTTWKLVRHVIPRRTVPRSMRNIETFLEDTQKNSKWNGNGNIETVSLYTDGIESDNDLMNNEFGQYGEMNNAWTSDDAKGFIKILEMRKTYFHQ
jgi:argininosuccinate synthase